MSLDFERARFNMVEQQVRTWDVLDARVLAALREVRREDFVLPRYRKLAFADVALPLDNGDSMMKPVVEGRTLQSLGVQSEDSVLEVGTGSGFLTACLAWLGREVTSVEIHEATAERARARLTSAGRTNARVETADALAFEPGREFDCVCVTGAVFAIPERFKRWLRVGGRLFAVRGEGPAMQAVLVTRTGDDEFREQPLFETELNYLVNAEPPKRFVL
ncbi:MAG TPA: protein-L-isoaspartate O-methyltransferase [Xanthomonadales bacterium]|nr:protein-L-isoaspartate O-methyltransferase [Xanthomonadales bacterium]